MANRRALIVAPRYDGEWLPPLNGTELLVERLRRCLETRGKYDVKVLTGRVTVERFLQDATDLFGSEGEILFYFYGHGCLRAFPGHGYFCTSSARPFNEGVAMNEIAAMATVSPAAEAVLIFDCCHAGAVAPVTRASLELAAAEISSAFGRDVLAACASDQQGWEIEDEAGRVLGAFSSFVLKGLEGAARRTGSGTIRGSLLGEYVTGAFHAWNQNPVIRIHEAGARLCTITFFEDAPTIPPVPLSGPPEQALILGTPFKPSQMFVGRAAELDWLRSTLLSGGKPVAISATVEGLGGIGKTELVIQLLHDPAIQGAFNTVVWLDGAGPLPPQWEKVATLLGLEFDHVPEEVLLQQVHAELRRRGHTLVVLDNASQWDPVEHLVPNGMPLLVTTRTGGFGGSNFRHFELGVLPEESATSLLVEIAPELKNDLGLPRLVESLDGHALALELAGWNIRHLGVSADEYIARLNNRKQDLRIAISATKYGNTVTGSLSLTWDGLSSDISRLLWRRASLFAPTSAHRELLRVSFTGGGEARLELEYRMSAGYIEGRGLPLGTPEDFDDAYAELRAFHVLARVEGHNGERWAMHRLVRDFGRSRVPPIETEAHVLALSEWLRDPSLPLAPEAPHFVVAILDSARQGRIIESRLGRSRNIASESFHRSGAIFFDSDYFIRFFRDELRDPKSFALILDGLTDINEDVRVQAVRLLETVGPMPEVLEAFVNALDDPDEEVRGRAVSALIRNGEERTINLLRAAVAGDKPTARRTAAHALGRMGDRALVALVESLASDDPAVRLQAALGLCEAGSEQGVPALLEIVRNPTFEINARDREVVSALMEIASKKELHLPIDSLGVILTGATDWQHRQSAAQLLGKSQDCAAVPYLIAGLNDSDYDVRREVCLALCQIPDPRAKTHLLSVLSKDYNSGVMGAAAAALLILGVENASDQITDPGAVSVMLKALTESGSPQALALARALVEQVGDAPSEVAWKTIAMLGGIGDMRWAGSYVGAAPTDKAREYAVASSLLLRWRLSPHSWEALADYSELLMKSTSRQVEQRAIAAAVLFLKHSCAGESCQVSPALLDRLSPDEGRIVSSAIALLGDPDGWSQEDMWRVVTYVAGAMSEFDSGELADSLCFDEEDNSTRNTGLVPLLLSLLVRHRVALPVRVARSLLQSQNASTRRGAVLCIGAARSKSSIPTLIRILGDPDPSVRRSTVVVLGAIGGTTVLGALRNHIVAETDDIVRDATECAIRSLSSSSSPSQSL